MIAISCYLCAMLLAGHISLMCLCEYDVIMDIFMSLFMPHNITTAYLVKDFLCGEPMVMYHEG